MSFSDISAYSLDCKGFNHSELVNPTSHKYQNRSRQMNIPHELPENSQDPNNLSTWLPQSTVT